MSRLKQSAVTISVIIAFLIVILALFKINNPLQTPMDSVPVDCGWVGVFFILANGFFFSYVLDRNSVGILERLLLTLGLGFGLTFVVMVLLGLLWEFSLSAILLTQMILLIVLSVIAVLRGFRVKPKTFRLPDKNSFRLTRLSVFYVICIVAIGILVFVAVYDTLSLPPTDWDSLAYGVNYARIMFQKSTIPLIAGPSIGIEMSASYPPGVQLAAVFLYVFAGSANDFYYRLLSPIFGFATFIVTYKFAMLLNKNRTISLYAIAALSSITIFWDLFIIESYLMALTFMLTMSAFFFYKAHVSTPSDAKKYELIAVLFGGFASLTSYIGLFSFGILLLYAVHKRLNVKRLAWLTALGLVVIFPWYSRNLILLGNPLYPFFGVGKYLYPLLERSTTLSFQQYNLVPEYGLLSTICKAGIAILVVAIGFFTFSKRKDFLVALPLYFLFMCATVMTLHVAFPRYGIIALPVLAVIFSAIINLAPKTRRLLLVVSVVLLSFIVLSSAMMLPYVNSVKPERLPGESESHYLSRVFQEGDAWQWINENSPANATIATFDIKEYYLDRNVFALDGNESVPLYQMNTVQECISFLQEKGIAYILSVPWASPGDIRMPLAYTWCPFTKYLGDPLYFPPVFVGSAGTTVYHVGPLDEKTVYQIFAQNDMVPPMRNVTVNLTITNSTYPYVGKFYLPIPVDYREGVMTASVNSSKPLDIELWNGLVPADQIENPSVNSTLISQWFIQCGNSSSVDNSSFTWHIDTAGYFTFIVLDKEKGLEGAFNATADLSFQNYLGT
jgi:hypothetical protein